MTHILFWFGAVVILIGAVAPGKRLWSIKKRLVWALSGALLWAFAFVPALYANIPHVVFWTGISIMCVSVIPRRLLGGRALTERQRWVWWGAGLLIMLLSFPLSAAL